MNLKPPKLYVNGFPKAGTHLAVRMALPLFTDKAIEETVWFGTNSWTTARGRLDEAVDIFSQIKPSTYLMGHTGYMLELEQLLDALKIIMLFVYRDLRDTVVSQTYHIMDDMGGKLKHPGRHRYDGMSKDEVMLACIEGIPDYPGVIERWNTFEPWLKVPFAHAVRFEDMIKKPEWCAKRFLAFVYGVSIAETGETEVYMDRELQASITEWIVTEMKQKHLSTTYRKGKTGAWKREFKRSHVQAFKRMDTDNALLRLGYVRKADW